MNAVRDYKYSVEYFKEHIKDDFYSAALKNFDFEKINLDELEYNVNRYYSIRYNRYKNGRSCLMNGETGFQTKAQITTAN